MLLQIAQDEQLKVSAASNHANNAQIVSPLPPHFDDPRFDERVLHNQKEDQRSCTQATYRVLMQN